jgi:hypothetical protein
VAGTEQPPAESVVSSLIRQLLAVAVRLAQATAIVHLTFFFQEKSMQPL